MTSRIHRGFHRIGVVLAAPLILLSAVLAVHETWEQQTTKVPPEASRPAPATPSLRPVPNYFDRFDPPAQSGPLTFDDITGPPGVSKPGMFDDLIPRPPPHIADYTMATIAFALAVALYAACRAVGWVLAGFIGPTGKL